MSMPWDWIAEKLAMGVGAQAAHRDRVLKARKDNAVIPDSYKSDSVMTPATFGEGN